MSIESYEELTDLVSSFLSHHSDCVFVETYCTQTLDKAYFGYADELKFSVRGKTPTGETENFGLLYHTFTEEDYNREELLEEYGNPKDEIKKKHPNIPIVTEPSAGIMIDHSSYWPRLPRRHQPT